MYRESKEVNSSAVGVMITHTKGLILGYIFIAIMLIIFAALESFVTNLVIGSLPLIIVSTLALLLSGGYTSIKVRNKGWLHGAINGIIFFALALVLKKVSGVELQAGYTAFRLVYCAIVASIGGIIGVNFF